MIAFENRRLMEHMTKILSEPQQKIRYVKPPSLNEVERKQKTDLINLDNRLLVERLKKVPPVIDVKKMKTDFDRHLKLASHMRRKFPGQTHKASPTKNNINLGDSLDGGVSNLGMGSAVWSEEGPPLSSGLGIDSISEFRRQVIHRKSGGGVKKMPQGKKAQQGSFGGSLAGDSQVSGGKDTSVHELFHEPEDTGSQVRFSLGGQTSP